MLLEVNNIAKYYGETHILEDVSFTLDQGESVAIVAPSGAGKSTLLSIVGLLLEPSKGEVLFNGVDVLALSDSEKAAYRAEKIGFLFQHTQLIGSLRAWENAALAADFAKSADAKLKDQEATMRAKELLEHFGLGERINYFPHQLSIGQKRRIATARALLMNPQLIIADEPTNDLDAENALLVTEALFARVKTGEAGLLYATHDRELAAKADKTLQL